jgi:very-short-patch-repair endonuclease
VSRILRELGRSPAALLGAGENMWKQRQQLKRQALLEERAHAMRHQPTQSEAKLWEALRGGQLGVHFKRQVRIGEFIVDFLAPAVKLVVEVDGGWHRGRVAADARRDRKLARLGYRVVRLRAELVLAHPAQAAALVRTNTTKVRKSC